MSLKFINREEGKGNIVLTFEGPAAELAQNANDFFLNNKYKLKKGSIENAVYERGNYIARVLLGAFIVYYKFNVIVEQEGNKAILTLSKAHSGMSGGVIGVVKLKKEFKKITDALEKADSTLGAFAMA